MWERSVAVGGSGRDTTKRYWVSLRRQPRMKIDYSCRIFMNPTLVPSLLWSSRNNSDVGCTRVRWVKGFLHFHLIELMGNLIDETIPGTHYLSSVSSICRRLTHEWQTVPGTIRERYVIEHLEVLLGLHIHNNRSKTSTLLPRCLSNSLKVFQCPFIIWFTRELKSSDAVLIPLF